MINDIITTTDAASVESRITRSGQRHQRLPGHQRHRDSQDQGAHPEHPGRDGLCGAHQPRGRDSRDRGVITVTTTGATSSRPACRKSCGPTPSRHGPRRGDRHLVEPDRHGRPCAQRHLFDGHLYPRPRRRRNRSDPDQQHQPARLISAAGNITGSATSPSHIVYDKVILNAKAGAIGSADRRLEVRSEDVMATASAGIAIGLSALGAETSRVITATTAAGGVNIVNGTGILYLGTVSAERAISRSRRWMTAATTRTSG